MQILTNILIGLIIMLHLYFVWLEMFAWTTHGKTVIKRVPDSFFKQTKALAANHGLYNCFLIAGLLWSFFIENRQWSENVAIFFLGCIAISGIQQSLTGDKSIFYVQGLPAIIALVLILTN